jgi:hypothetical protein
MGGWADEELIPVDTKGGNKRKYLFACFFFIRGEEGRSRRGCWMGDNIFAMGALTKEL